MPSNAMPQAKFIQEMICSEFAAWGSEAKALPSIASVSEMIVETATAEEEEGDYVILKGKVEENRPANRKGTK